MNSRTTVIGIAGGSASGKSYLCQWMHVLTAGKVTTLPLDCYYRCNGHLSLEARSHINYDTPNAFDVPLLIEHLNLLRKGRAVPVPMYDFTSHCRLEETSPLMPAELILVEGILTLHWPELRALFDFTIFVDAPAHLRLARRLARDVRERGRTEESVRLQWEATVEPMYRRYCEVTRLHAQLVVDGSGDVEEGARAILARLT